MRTSTGEQPFAAIVTLLGVISFGSLVDAQTQQQGTTGGTRGTTGVATGGTTGGTLGGGTTGTSSAGGLGGTGRSTGAGGQGSGMTGGGIQQPEFRAFGDTANQNSSGFVGRAATDQFIGQQALGQQGAGAGANALGALFGGLAGGQAGTNRGTGQSTGRSRAAQLRPRHRFSSAYVPIPRATVRSNLQAHLGPVRSRLNGAQISLDDSGTLTLRGTAASPDDRKLAEAVARLEPGVRRIDNQITVPTAANEPLVPVPQFP